MADPVISASSIASKHSMVGAYLEQSEGLTTGIMRPEKLRCACPEGTEGRKIGVSGACPEQREGLMTWWHCGNIMSVINRYS